MLSTVYNFPSCQMKRYAVYQIQQHFKTQMQSLSPINQKAETTLRRECMWASGKDTRYLHINTFLLERPVMIPVYSTVLIILSMVFIIFNWILLKLRNYRTIQACLLTNAHKSNQ